MPAALRPSLRMLMPLGLSTRRFFRSSVATSPVPRRVSYSVMIVTSVSLRTMPSSRVQVRRGVRMVVVSVLTTTPPMARSSLPPRSTTPLSEVSVLVRSPSSKKRTWMPP